MSTIESTPLLKTFNPAMLRMLNAAPAMTAEEQQELIQVLPANLGPEDIRTIGVMAWNHANNPNIEHDGASNPRRYERQVVFSLGKLSLIEGDATTVQSAALHLQGMGDFLSKKKGRSLVKSLNERF